jgi:Protein of unknown function (DUF2934)
MDWSIRRTRDGQESIMPNDSRPTPSEDEIRNRSYLIWEREGCQHGKSEEYWLRAKTELEAELEANWHAASMEGETTTFVLPVLPISTPPSRSVSSKLAADSELKKKAVG